MIFIENFFCPENIEYSVKNFNFLLKNSRDKFFLKLEISTYLYLTHPPIFALFFQRLIFDLLFDRLIFDLRACRRIQQLGIEWPHSPSIHSFDQFMQTLVHVGPVERRKI